MTFNPQKWIQQAWNQEDTKKIKIAGEEITIRRLSGTQWEAYMKATGSRSADSAVAFILQHGVVKAHGQYTYEEMAKFYDTNPVFADKIAVAILEHTSQRMAAEQQALEEAEKNSETIHTSPSSDDGAENTDKTPKPSKSAAKNSCDSNDSKN